MSKPDNNNSMNRSKTRIDLRVHTLYLLYRLLKSRFKIKWALRRFMNKSREPASRREREGVTCRTSWQVPVARWIIGRQNVLRFVRISMLTKTFGSWTVTGEAIYGLYIQFVPKKRNWLYKSVFYTQNLAKN